MTALRPVGRDREPGQRLRLLAPGGALHPGVSWTRFAVAGVVGFVFLAGLTALTLLVPESRKWTAMLGAIGVVLQLELRRRRRERAEAARGA